MKVYSLSVLILGFPTLQAQEVTMPLPELYILDHDLPILSDEVDGPRHMSYDLGAGGWGNVEIQNCSSSAENSQARSRWKLYIRSYQHARQVHVQVRNFGSKNQSA